MLNLKVNVKYVNSVSGYWLLVKILIQKLKNLN